jgi:hypothetical protein
MHFDVGGEENWHKIGDVLAPKRLWQPHLRGRPGMKALQIEEAKRADGLAGKVLVTVQPSEKYTHGVFFDVNNDLPNADGKPGTSFAVQVIREHWARLLLEARFIAETVLEQATS